MKDLINYQHNIVIFDGNSRYFLGGGQKVTLEMLRGLKGKFAFFLIGVDQNNEFIKRASREGLESKKEFRKLFDLVMPFAMLKAFKEWSIRRNETTLYFPSKKGFALMLWARLFGFKVVMHIHSVNSRNGLVFLWTRWLSHFASKVIVPSQFVREYFFLEEAEVISNPVGGVNGNETLIRSGMRRSIVFIGSIEVEKGVENFCKMADLFQIEKCDNGYEFHVYGTGNLLDRLRGRYGFIKFHGYVENPIEKIHSSVLVVCVPSLVPESFSLVTAESISHGIPVVTGAYGAQADIVRQYQGSGIVNNLAPLSLKIEVKRVIDGFNEVGNYPFKRNDVSLFKRELFYKKMIEALS